MRSLIPKRYYRPWTMAISPKSSATSIIINFCER